MLIHEFENHHHRLIYADGSKFGDWVSCESIARLDDYGAAVNHNLPSVFRVEEVKDYKNCHLGLNSDDYWGKSSMLSH